MKKTVSLSLAVALALAVTPVAAFAEDNGTNTESVQGEATTQDSQTTTGAVTDPQKTVENQKQTTDTDQKGDQKQTAPKTGQQPADQNKQDRNGQPSQDQQQQAVDIKIEEYYVVPLNTEDGNFTGLNVTAKLTSVKDKSSVKGKWTLSSDADKTTLKNKVKFDDAVLLSDAKDQVVKLTFEGQVDGQNVKVEKTLNVHVPTYKVSVQSVGGKQQLTGTISDAKEAKGNWHFVVGDQDDQNVIAEQDLNGVTGLTASHTFELKEGTYVVGVYFEGEVDGTPVILGFGMEQQLDVKGDGKQTVTPAPAPKPEDKKPVINPEKAKQELSQAKEGGKLPKTATNYPIGTVAGAALLAGGLAMLRLRRTV
jgi:LPXTG-motif cell wall-anchored protein